MGSERRAGSMATWGWAAWGWTGWEASRRRWGGPPGWGGAFQRLPGSRVKGAKGQRPAWPQQGPSVTWALPPSLPDLGSHGQGGKPDSFRPGLQRVLLGTEPGNKEG